MHLSSMISPTMSVLTNGSTSKRWESFLDHALHCTPRAEERVEVSSKQSSQPWVCDWCIFVMFVHRTVWKESINCRMAPSPKLLIKSKRLLKECKRDSPSIQIQRITFMRFCPTGRWLSPRERKSWMKNSAMKMWTEIPPALSVGAFAVAILIKAETRVRAVHLASLCTCCLVGKLRSLIVKRSHSCVRHHRLKSSDWQKANLKM